MQVNGLQGAADPSFRGFTFVAADALLVNDHEGGRATRALVARGLSGVELVTSDAHAGLVARCRCDPAGMTWQRCRTHWAAR